jgi:hypothetical protein
MRQNETEKTDKKDGEIAVFAVSCIKKTYSKSGITHQQNTRYSQFQVRNMIKP